MSAWPGHRAITRTRMLAILERAVAGARDLSVDERALFTACEFRASVAARVLCAHLRSNAVEKLRTIALVYAAIGAPHFARLLDDAQADLSCLSTSRERKLRLKLLEHKLRESPDSVDRLLAQFAETVHPPAASDTRALHARRQRLRVVLAMHCIAQKAQP
jgi:hypothetical protein